MKTKNIMITIFLFIVCSIYVNSIITPVAPLNPNTQITDTPFQTTQNTTTNINVSVVNNITTINNFTTIINITNNISTMTQNNFSIINNITVVNNITNNISNNFYAGWLNTVYNVTNVINVTNNISFLVAEMTINITNNVTVDVNNIINLTVYSNQSNNITIIDNIYNITNNITNTIINNVTNNITNNITNYASYNTSYVESYNTTTFARTLTTEDIWYNISTLNIGEYSLGWNTTSINGELQCKNSGLYIVTYNVIASLNAPNELDYRMIKNNVAIDKSLIKQQYVSGNVESVSMSFIERFAINDTILLQVSNIDVNGKILTQYNRNIILTKIAD